MDTATIIELIGYLGSVLVLVSMLMTSVVRLRVINLIGSILKDWSDRGIDTLEAVHADDKLFKEAQEKKYGKKGPAAGNAGENSANKFNRFEQRETDFSEDEALFMSKHRKKKSEAASDAGNT